MRLHWFLPHKTYFGTPGRLLRRALPSWRNSPLRRIAQTLALATFIALLFYVLQPAPPSADGQAVDLSAAQAQRQFLPPQLFLVMDPLASVLAATAARAWIWSLAGAGILLALNLLVPRGFCGYLCPLGTLIDLFDWIIGGRFKRLHLRGRSWHAHLKYYLLAAVVLLAGLGVTLGSFIAAIPLLTRGLAAVFGLSQANSPPVSWPGVLAIALLTGVLLLGVLGKRFWCRYVCPTGAALSLISLLRLTDRKVTDKCVECGKCVRACPFDAIKPDFTTRGPDCTFCQTCGGACPTAAIEFRPRWQNQGARPTLQQPPEVSLSRRGFLASGIGSVALALGLPRLASGAADQSPVRPPASLPEEAFSKTCIRCGLCVKACPTNLLQPMDSRAGLDKVWTPYANADWGKCDPTCNLCGKVCPTGAIQHVSVEEKKSRKMGLARIDTKTCLAYAGEDCAFCMAACADAGYAAIQPADEPDASSEGAASSEPAARPPRPVVNADWCVGCGACQHACRTNLVLAGKLRHSAIVVRDHRFH